MTPPAPPAPPARQDSAPPLPLLEMKALVGGYGAADILKGASLQVLPGQIVVIIGPNGAGKSTLMKAAFGLVTLRQGHVHFDGTDITHLRTDKIVRRGMAYVPQERNVFASMSVQDNLDIGAMLDPKETARRQEHVFSLFPRLKERRRQLAGQMSGGERQMLAMGRALMQGPKLILLDEPTAGLSPLFIEQTFELIKTIHQAGVSVLMVEQNAKQALAIADRALVVVMGQNRHEASGAAMLADPDIGALFLGG